MLQIRTNANQVMRNLTQRLTNPQAIDVAIRTLATTMLAEVKTRVFEQGEASDGGEIGQYSIKETYVSVAESPRQFTPRGKTGKVTFKSGKPHKSRYFPGGYKEFRGLVGRPNEKVNLSLFGQFNAQMTVIPTAKGYGIGWNNREMFERAGYFTKKYRKPIWKLTERESELAKELAKKYYLDAISESNSL